MSNKKKEHIDRRIKTVIELFIDKGVIIESGWHALRAEWVSPEASDAQVREMRMAFFAGAQHLWASIMSVLEAGQDPTTADMRRLDLIEKELRAFYEEMKREHGQQ